MRPYFFDLFYHMGRQLKQSGLIGIVIRAVRMALQSEGLVRPLDPSLQSVKGSLRGLGALKVCLAHPEP